MEADTLRYFLIFVVLVGIMAVFIHFHMRSRLSNIGQEIDSLIGCPIGAKCGISLKEKCGLLVSFYSPSLIEGERLFDGSCTIKICNREYLVGEPSVDYKLEICVSGYIESTGKSVLDNRCIELTDDSGRWKQLILAKKSTFEYKCKDLFEPVAIGKYDTPENIILKLRGRLIETGIERTVFDTEWNIRYLPKAESV